VSGFTFGQNWKAYSRVLDEQRLDAAAASLQQLLGMRSVDGLTVADVGAGSGLFSLAMIRLGAAHVTAIDRDPECVAVIRDNADRFLEPTLAAKLDVRPGDVLEPRTLPDARFDVVYAWGSLHHTGAMWPAIEHAAALCGPGGLLVLAVYNQTWFSRGWLAVKRVYHRAPSPVQVAMAAALAMPRAAARAIRGRSAGRTDRGMSVWYDAVDWLGGLPYECARPEAVESFLAARGFALVRRWTTRRHGCNQFTFRRLTSNPGGAGMVRAMAYEVTPSGASSDGDVEPVTGEGGA
jgi:2-polyprenyl-6-hydroxyphenyl methylase/3-demethylubiquinone-9 3-methyltransferase